MDCRNVLLRDRMIGMRFHIPWLVLPALIGLCGLLTAVQAQALQSGDPGFGQQWLRENPFSIQAISFSATTWDIDEYFGAGMTLLNWELANPNTILNLPPEYADARWQAIIPVTTGVPLAKAYYNSLRVRPNNAGWLVGDEPNRLALPDHGEVAAYIRQTDPSQLVYTTSGHMLATAADWYGDASNPSYTYDDYLNDYVSILDPDLLSYDFYACCRSDGTTDSLYFENLMIIRDKAQANGLPYWAWMQSWGISTNRYPSESDNRFNVYSHLTAGYTGLEYWTYDYYSSTGKGLIDINGTPTALYFAAAQTNAEAATQGQSLRFLTSTDVRFIPGGVSPTPSGLTNWDVNAGPGNLILDISVDGTPAADKDGLIGFFTDDGGDDYFMLTNLNHGANLSAAATTLSFTIAFDNSVNSIWRLNRVSGVPEEITLTNNELNWTLPGGTGDLFRYDNGNFAGLDLVVSADFDNNNIVDGLDFLIWQQGLLNGTTHAEGDANLDGTVDGTDLGIWESQYGGPPPLVTAVAAVPEPTSLMLLAMGWLATKYVRPLRKALPTVEVNRER